MPLTPIPKPPLYKQGRSGIILALGILSVLSLGPILGIPAWIMGRNDLRLIRAGAGPKDQRGITKGGMIAGIIGTFISPVNMILYGIVIAIVLSINTANAIVSNKEGIIADINKIGNIAYNNKNGKSYKEFVLFPDIASNSNAIYKISLTNNGELFIKGESVQFKESFITAIVDSQGNLGKWSYSEIFAP